MNARCVGIWYLDPIREWNPPSQAWKCLLFDLLKFAEIVQERLPCISHRQGQFATETRVPGKFVKVQVKEPETYQEKNVCEIYFRQQ